MYLWIEASIEELKMRFEEAIRSDDFIKNEGEPYMYKKISVSMITL